MKWVLVRILSPNEERLEIVTIDKSNFRVWFVATLEGVGLDS